MCHRVFLEMQASISLMDVFGWQKYKLAAYEGFGAFRSGCRLFGSNKKQKQILRRAQDDDDYSAFSNDARNVWRASS